MESRSSGLCDICFDLLSNLTHPGFWSQSLILNPGSLKVAQVSLELSNLLMRLLKLLELQTCAVMPDSFFETEKVFSVVNWP